MSMTPEEMEAAIIDLQNRMTVVENRVPPPEENIAPPPTNPIQKTQVTS